MTSWYSKSIKPNETLHDSAPFLSLLIGSFEVKIKPFFLWRFVFGFGGSIFHWALSSKIIAKNSTATSITEMPTSTTGSNNSWPCNSECGMDSVSLFQQFIHLLRDTSVAIAKKCPRTKIQKVITNQEWEC